VVEVIYKFLVYNYERKMGGFANGSTRISEVEGRGGF
jgi:hypothetical protein